MSNIEYKGLSKIYGPLIVIEKTDPIGYNEIVQIITPDGHERLGMVLETAKDYAVVQVFEGTDTLSIKNTRVIFTGSPLKLKVNESILGRVFNGVGRPIDGGTDIVSDKELNVNGAPLNPTAREYPKKFIQTGISAIDGMNTLIRGQKLPIFSGNGIPHNELARQIIQQASIPEENTEFVVVFAAMGLKYDVANFFIKGFQEAGVMDKVVMFLSLADQPSVERIVTPRSALTAAEYLAFEKNMHVLVVMSDMSNYCESLREIATLREEIPGRKGYPGYLYSDLASLYERAGMVEGKEGSITQVPILTMPNDDISHPIPDLTGYITEGQIVLDRELTQRGIYPPVAELPSLSRLMKDGIGEGFTREDHPHLASQLFAAYSKVQNVRALASVIGEEELTPLDKNYIEFGKAFETQFLSQSETENRTIFETLDKGWAVLSILPPTELNRLTEDEIKKYYRN